MMKTRYAMGLAMALAGYAASPLAADEPSAVLQQSKGQVFVGQATNMVSAQPNMPLYTGNRVVVAVGGAATVAYIDGCTVTLPENSLLAVGSPGQCKAGLATVRATGSFQNARVGQVPQGNPPPPGDDDDGPDGIKKTTGSGGTIGGVPTGVAITGGLFGVMLVGAAINDDDDPASP